MAEASDIPGSSSAAVPAAAPTALAAPVAPRGVIPDLLQHPQRYAFFQAVRLLVRWLVRQGIAPEQALGLIRFRNSLALGFPPSEIEAIACTTEGAPAVNVTPALMGLLGVSGALPLHYTERFAAWEAESRDGGARAFLDLFSSRQVALFYRAWCKYRLRHPADGEHDRLLPLLLALAGGAQSATDDLAAPDPETLACARFAAALRSRVVSAGLIAGVLRAYFQVPVAVEQFSGRWDVLAPDQRTLLARGNCELGAGATAGARLPRPELGMRVRLGPLEREEFERFLPGAAGSRALAGLLDRFAIEVPYRELQVVLRRDAVGGVNLDGATRLGLDGFLCTASGGRDRDDVCYLLP
ncbi:type VI secretion system baseplate subunit TssG [Massilia sp. YIM B02443]|uniref:type VI secretion system baseplate subunit TssG n=1 Tax=Massilia sp. YIM B02443 TaxID=3050127 RepID=UPI0025B71F73|nr:type VI secretion system baseplate subunit TssG [Massilia sp. YIM B02443]MDN4036720.1 type VI secretion system baseplate subunit TssG [Massilia sp. YIM B02443]